MVHREKSAPMTAKSIECVAKSYYYKFLYEHLSINENGFFSRFNISLCHLRVGSFAEKCPIDAPQKNFTFCVVHPKKKIYEGDGAQKCESEKISCPDRRRQQHSHNREHTEQKIGNEKQKYGEEGGRKKKIVYRKTM